MMKEGLLGGTLSVAWPLLHLEGRQVELECKQDKIDDHSYYVLEYGARKSLGGSQGEALFDPETFRHVRTEYRVRIKNDSSALPSVNSSATISSTSGLATTDTNRRRPDERQANATNSFRSGGFHLLMVEKFSNFAAVDGVVLPKDYSIEYSAQGSGNAFIAGGL